MDPAIIASVVAASAGQAQLGLAQKMVAMNLDAGRSIVKLIDSAQQSMNSLANVGPGIGANVDMTA
jgi:hypothetical protein